MTPSELQKKLYTFLTPAYPDIEINVVDTVTNIRQLYFTSEKFRVLYPKQRYHYVAHLIPSDFCDQNLQGTTWFELAPNENPADVDYHDQATIDDIKDIILLILQDKVEFFSLPDKEF